MSSQRGFRRRASCQTSFGVCLTDGEQPDVSLASHAARVASFVHCRTRGCEAIPVQVSIAIYFAFSPRFSVLSDVLKHCLRSSRVLSILISIEEIVQTLKTLHC